ncbi:MAG: discoidin domain-containing protein, partial [Lentisphaeria bacterium]|nr:discoidin domain-containing protein [Lentisphaeria bacterium]
VKVRFPGTDLTDGAYFLEVTAGKEYKRSIRIRKLPYQPGEVWLDAQGITHVDGKRFLPYGWFIFQPSDPKTKAFNSQLNYGIGSKSLNRFNQWLTRYAEAGLKSIVFPYQEFSGKHDWKIFAHSTRDGGLRPEQKKHLEKYIPQMKKHPSLLAWYFADEPESRGGNNPQWFVQTHEVMQELDPYHPNLMLNWGISGMQQFYEGCDILMPDCYIRYMADGTTIKPRWAISDWMKAAAALGKPAWLVPQVFLWGTAAPTFDDYRAEIYQALIHNCKGFQLYNFPESRLHSSLTVAPDAVGLELMQIKDLVLENTIPGAVMVKTPKGAEHFQVGLKCWNGKYILIAVNTSLKSFTADFTVNRNFSGELHVLGEKRSVKLVNGQFKDRFGPAETHVYLTSKKQADSVEDLPSVRNRIARMRAARKKPGNKVALGEIDNFRIYREYEQGKRPPHVAEIKGSSDLRTWFLIHMYKMSTFYFLFDGVTDHSSDFMIWSPAEHDKNPWIEITLPKEETISKIVLYTIISQNGKARLTDAEVSGHDGKGFVKLKSASARKGNRIEITFPEVITTKKIRLTGFKFTPGESRRALTEIEIY